MRKKFAIVFMITALIFSSGTLEMFAGTESEEAAAGSEAASLETQAEEETAAEVTETEAVEEEAQSDADEDAATAAEERQEAEDPEAADDNEEVLTVEQDAGSAVLENVTASADGTAVTLKWDYSEGSSLAAGETLTVKYKGSKAEKTIGNVTGTSVVIDGLAVNTAYSFKILYNGIAAGEASVTTGTKELSGVKTLSSYKRVYVKWKAVDGAKKYSVTWKSKKNGSGGKKNITATKYRHNNIKPYDLINSSKGPIGYTSGKDRFTYTIKAYNSDNEVIATSKTTGDVVKTLYYKITFKRAASLTSHSGGKKTVTFKKGQVIYAKAFNGGKYIFDYKCRDGKVRTFYSMKIRVNAKLSNHIAVEKKVKNNKKLRGTSTVTYSAKEAQLFVNERGIRSNTKYLIWANLFTQKEYVFYSPSKGKKHDWKLVTAKINNKNRLLSAQQVSSGKATKPTSSGSTKIVRRMNSCNGIPCWNVTKYFSLHGIQSSMMTPGYPESGACVRNKNDNIKWIYSNIPMYTRVFIH